MGHHRGHHLVLNRLLNLFPTFSITILNGTFVLTRTSLSVATAEVFVLSGVYGCSTAVSTKEVVPTLMIAS